MPKIYIYYQRKHDNREKNVFVKKKQREKCTKVVLGPKTKKEKKIQNIGIQGQAKQGEPPSTDRQPKFGPQPNF